MHNSFKEENWYLRTILLRPIGEEFLKGKVSCTLLYNLSLFEQDAIFEICQGAKQMKNK